MKILIRTIQGATYRGYEIKDKIEEGILLEINPQTQTRVFIPYAEVSEVFSNKKRYCLDEYINN